MRNSKIIWALNRKLICLILILIWKFIRSKRL